MVTTPPAKRFMIVDGNALIHRAFHALPPLTTKSGQLVNAVYGFFLILFKAIKELSPDYIAITFDVAGETFRKKLYPAYKAQRKKQPDELYQQIDITKEIISTLNIPIYTLAGVEADDVIGTIVTQIPENITSYIVTGDADALQLVNEHTKVFTLRKGMSDTVIYDVAGVTKKYSGLTPEQLIDYKALRGDPSDNIPGIHGIGEKGAINLLLKYHTLDAVLAHAHELAGSLQKKVATGQADAELSKQLATINCAVPIKFNLTDTIIPNYDTTKVITLLQQYEFKSLIKLLPSFGKTNTTVEQNNSNYNKPTSTNHYILIDSANKAKELAKQLANTAGFAFDTETTSLDTLQCSLVGFSVCWQPDTAYFVLAEYVAYFKTVFENSHIKKIGHNAKFDYQVLKTTTQITVQGLVFDTMLAAYLLRPGSRGYGLDALAFNEFGYQMMSYNDLVKNNDGKTTIPITAVAKDKLTFYAAEDAYYTWKLYDRLKTAITKNNLAAILEMEVALIPVLANMEHAGIAIDLSYLKQFSIKLHKQISTLEKKIHALAGSEFNIASPKQLKEILFTKLNINQHGLAKTKTGISTAAAELEKMRDLHPIIPFISDYRELTKLASTYVDALPKLVSPKTNRVHTHFNQTIAATGRLSSSNPNLQNIPIRTELGREIRRAFIAPSGYQLLSLDYSQIELRIVAHLANDPEFINSFKQNTDIHTQTAAALNNLPINQVTKELRRAAKSVNFGILYGMGAHGLVRDAGISVAEAKQYLAKYFTLHPAIQQYIEQTKQQAHTNGYVETLFGRKRYLPDLQSGMPMLRAAAERAAVNMPIQGTAADLIKLAMLEIAKQITAGNINTIMLLQVHDELVFEVLTDNLLPTAQALKEIMEQIYTLAVPLCVAVKTGTNWNELKPL
ncbi:MAG: DNA polymerase I [Patescibacteria group bacterium]|jgi:DNA polymerase-1